MKKTSRLFLFVALILVLLMAACGAEQGTSPTTVVGTILPGDEDLTSTPAGGTATAGTAETAAVSETPTGGVETATATANITNTAAAQVTGTQPVGTTQTAVIPVTGEDIMLVECQFCVDTRAHALIVLPDTATFQIVSPAVTPSSTTDTQPTCTTVEVNNGRQVVLCSGPEMTPLVVNICTSANNCTDFPVDLLACPQTPGGSVSPSQTRTPGTAGMSASPTTNPGVVINTATPSGATATVTVVP